MINPFAAIMLIIAAAVTSPAQADDKKLVTIVGSAEPQTQLMSMVLSMQSLKQGASIYILLCGPGGDLALKAPRRARLRRRSPRA